METQKIHLLRSEFCYGFVPKGRIYLLLIYFRYIFNLGFCDGKKSSLSVQLLQRLVYTAAKVDARWFIQLIFNQPAGRIAFDSYRERCLLPEDVANANGHEETARYLKDVTKRYY